MKKQFLLALIFAALYSTNISANIRYVKPTASGTGNGSSWANASADLQAIINTSASNDQIWVAAGTYLPTQDPFGSATPTNPRDRTFYLKDSVKIYGGFAGTETALNQRNWVTNTTILSGDFNNDDVDFTNNTENAYHVVLSVRDSSVTVVDGFTIKGGNADGPSYGSIEIESEIITSFYGGGIACYASNLSITNVTLTGNVASNGGGMNNESSNPTLSNVTISNNTANVGGGMNNQSSNPSLSNVTIKNNTSNGDGGGIYNGTSSPNLSNVTIKNNTASNDGGGMSNYSASSPILINVILSDNIAGNNGGGLSNLISCVPTLKNVVISGNAASNDGGGISNNSTTAFLFNVSIWGNSATYFGGGMENINAGIFMTNCIVWSNTSGLGQGVYNYLSTATISYSDIQDSLYAGTGNISTNPLFTNPTTPAGADGIWLTADDGLQLSSCTNPCVNTGTNNNAPVMDILGNAINADIKDMGAYEFIALPQTPMAISTTDTILYVKKGSTGNGSTWANAMGELGNALNSVDNVPGNMIKQIWVAQGTYTPLFAPSFITCPTLPDPRDHSFYLKNNIKMYGGFAGTETLLTQRNWVANPTILSGDFNNDDVGFNNNVENAYHVVLSVNDSSSTVLDGFTIKGGNTNDNTVYTITVENKIINSYDGGGIHNINSNTNFSNLIIIGNTASGGSGGGIFNRALGNVSSSPALSNVTISGNKAVGGGGIANSSEGLLNNNANINLNNVIISGNIATGGGGGIVNSYASPILNNVTISGNRADGGGGMSSSGKSNLSLSNVTISNNSAITQYYGGGGLYINASGTTNSTSSLNNVTISNNNSTNEGGGIYIVGNTNTNINLSYVIIKNNTAKYDGGGISNRGTNLSLNNVGILSNSVTGIVAPPFATSGGGILNVLASPTLSNVVISGNTTTGYGGGMANTRVSNPILTNVTISGNIATINGGGIANSYEPSEGPSNPILKNTIVWGNTGGGTKGIYSQSGNTPIITYSNIQDSLYTGAGNISADPLFTNPTNTAGADSILLTADDGLQLSCASPCINTGTNTGVPALDILGNAIFGSTKDMGTYEVQSSSSPVLAANYQTSTQNVSNNVFTATSCILITKITPNGNAPAVGDVTAKVWIDAAQNTQFVKRHYEITPATNAANATARVTLYFTQAEFNDFNALNNVKLPISNTDAAGKANLLIEKRAGIGDANGLFSSYTGAITNINPADEDIVWNGSSNRWEVSFNITGFSGFWVKTQTSVLPLKLLSFTGKRESSSNQLNWVTASEINTNRFEIAYSTDGVNFNTIGNVNAKGNSQINNYQFSHNIGNTTAFYRLKMIDNDGTFKYSDIIIIREGKVDDVSIYPNPFDEEIKVVNNYKNASYILFDMVGKQMKQGVLRLGFNTLNLKIYANGIYVIRIMQNGIVVQTEKLVKK
jgi:hypothetical protein